MFVLNSVNLHKQKTAVRFDGYPYCHPNFKTSNQDNYFAKELILSNESGIELVFIVLFNAFECFQKVIGGHSYCPPNQKLQIKIINLRNYLSLVVKAK